jgi:hypothetical protein
MMASCPTSALAVGHDRRALLGPGRDRGLGAMRRWTAMPRWLSSQPLPASRPEPSHPSSPAPAEIDGESLKRRERRKPAGTRNLSNRRKIYTTATDAAG